MSETNPPTETAPASEPVVAAAPAPPADDHTEHPTSQLKFIDNVLHQMHIVMDRAGATIASVWRKVPGE